MKKRVITILTFAMVICLFYFTGCKNHNDNIFPEHIRYSSDFEVISIGNISERQPLDSVVQNYYYLPLQTTDSCLIGSIDKVLFHDDKIFLLDKYLTKSIFVFDMNGKFVYKISKVGKGPGEYDKIQDFEIDSISNQVKVLCTNMRKLICYDPDNGNYIMEKKLNSAPLSFVEISKNLYLFDCRLQLINKDCILNVVDSLGKAITGYFPRTNHTSAEKNPFSRYRESVYYCSNYCDTIFEFKNDSLFKKYYVDFGSNKLNVSQLPEELYTSKGVLKSKIVGCLDGLKLKEYANREGIAFQVSSFLESDSIIKFNFIYNGKYYVALYNKTNRHIKTYSALVQGEEICFDIVSYSIFKNWYVGVVNSDILTQTLSKRKKSILQNCVLKETHLPESITENDNPMLIFVRYKRF